MNEHLWHHVSTKPVADGGRGPKDLTDMVDLTRDATGHARARLLDLVPGRSSKAYADWIKERDEAFRAGARSQLSTRSPAARILDDATAVLDAFHVVKLGTAAVDDVRRRVQQDTLDHRGRMGDPLYGIRYIRRAGREHLVDKQKSRLETSFPKEEHVEVEVASHAALQLLDDYRHSDQAKGCKLAEQVLDSFPDCAIPEIAGLGRTLPQWRTAFLVYWTTDRSSSCGTEAANGLIEPRRRVARGEPTTTTTDDACSSSQADSIPSPLPDMRRARLDLW